jgi:diacylglycerol kinase family enzyme
VTADGEEVFDGCGLALVGIMARYPAGLRVLNRARPDDGMLDVCAVPCESRPKLVRHAVNVLRQVHDRTGGMVYRKCLRARVEGENGVPLEIDGDAGGCLPADFSVLPAAATVLVPPALTDDRSPT